MEIDLAPIWECTGSVTDVDLENQTITFWFDTNFREVQTVPISPKMPNWLLKKGVPFKCTMPRLWIREGRIVAGQGDFGGFGYELYAYLQGQELIDYLLADLDKTTTEQTALQERLLAWLKTIEFYISYKGK